MVVVAACVATGPVEAEVETIRRTGSVFAAILGADALLVGCDALVAGCCCTVRLVVLVLNPFPPSKLTIVGAGRVFLAITGGEDREIDASSAALLAVSLSISAR
jgi:hypothetical protein